MDMLQRLKDNYEAERNSFLYYLHERNFFHEEAFSELCECILDLSRTHPGDKDILLQISFIYEQVLKHIIYHFDPNDLSIITNFPCDYNEKLELLGYLVTLYKTAV